MIPARRVVTSHDPSDTDGTNVVVYDDTVPIKSILDGSAGNQHLYSFDGCPAINSHVLSPQDLQASADRVNGVVFPGGTNLQVTELAPNSRVGYHRTSSVDHNIFIAGSCTLVTPLPDGREKRTLVKAGDVVVQRGTLHAWEAGPEGARWYTVVVSALPVKTGGSEKPLEDVDF